MGYAVGKSKDSLNRTEEMELDISSKQALNQVFTMFDDHQKDFFYQWLEKPSPNSVSGYELLHGHPYYVIHLQNNKVASDTLSNVISGSHKGAFEEFLNNIDIDKSIYFFDGVIFFKLQSQNHSRSNRSTVLAITEKSITDFLRFEYSHEKLTPGEIRTILQFMADNNLKLSAKKDSVSFETKRKQYKTGAVKMGFSKQAELVSTVISKLLLELMFSQNSPEITFFEEYCKRYLPREIRIHLLTDKNGCQHRVLDIGNRNDTPIIVLHPKILPDLLRQDITTLKEDKIRLLFPLRHGALEPEAKYLSSSEQLQHCTNGIETVRELLCEGPFILVSLVTSAWYAIRYTELYPDKIATLVCVSASNPLTKKKSESRSFIEGLITLAARNEFILDRALSFSKEYFKGRDRFKAMLRRTFSGSEADLKIINTELESPRNGERFYLALSNSIASIKHDFFHQSDSSWKRLKETNVPVVFLHGTEDVIDTIKDIQDLMEMLPDAKLYPIEGCGQLLYYEHFEKLSKLLSKISKNIEVR